MKKLITAIAMAACAAAMTGCRVLKVEDYGEEVLRGQDGQVLVDSSGSVQKVRKGYRVYHNGHWMRTEAESITGGIDRDGKMDFAMNGIRSDASEEYNKMMQTTFQGFAALARLAAACYSPAAASIPLSTEAADPAATAKLVEAQGAANAAEIKAKSDKETAKIKANSDALVAQQEAKAKAAAAEKAAQAAATCADGTCTQN